MKKWTLIFSVCALCAIGLTFVKVNVTENWKIIILRDGEPVLADHVSRSDQFVIYEIDGNSFMFMKDDVKEVKNATVEKKIGLLKILDQQKQIKMIRLGISPKWIRILDTRLFIFALFLVVAVAIDQLAPRLWGLVWQALRKRKENKSEQFTETVKIVTDAHQESSDLRDLALFFLDMFRVQKGLANDAQARYRMTGNASFEKMNVFELSVMGAQEWQTRRVSIGPLGEEAGSKSKCFYVIYDTHMVIKMPPSPVTDMNMYLTAIRREVQIATHLSPIACIVPRVSVVLEKVWTVPYAESLNLEQLEKRYIRLLEEEAEYRQYLKVGDQFAFFMELTNNFFLSRVIDELHAPKEKLGDEIRKAPDEAWEQEGFTARYGLESLSLFKGLQELYRTCDIEVRRAVKESGREVNIQPFQIRSWMLSKLANETFNREAWNVGETLTAQIERRFSTIFSAHQQLVDDLTRLIKTHLSAKAFLKSRKQIENISSNALILLQQLREKRIALRDLKPDNLFLDAHPDDYPVVLRDSSAFSIGIIDVETAVSLIPGESGAIEQPLLGGTPLYATPLHLLKNEVLANYFQELSQAYYIQDWFAMLAIIFKTITGKNLFQRAARSFPEVVKMLKSGSQKKLPDESTVKAMNQKFWSAAIADVRVHLSVFSEQLNQLTLTVPGPMVPMLREELERETKCLAKEIEKRVSCFPHVKGEKNRNFFMGADIGAIKKQVSRLKDATRPSEKHQKLAHEMIAFLENLIRLKQGMGEKSMAITTIDSSNRQISAYCLVEAMFQIAFRNMYKSHWRTIPEPYKDLESMKETPDNDKSQMVTKILTEVD